MSQYIGVKQSHTGQDCRNVLGGLVSKICTRDSSCSLLKNEPNRRYFRQKISLRQQREQEYAQLKHHQALMAKYKNLKHKLALYGRSKSCKLNALFEKDGMRLSVRESVEEAKRISIRPARVEREVVIGEKYNRELAVKAAVLREIEQVQEMKRRTGEAAKQTFNRSLSIGVSCQANEAAGRRENPVLVEAKSSKLRKKKKKFLFA